MREQQKTRRRRAAALVVALSTAAAPATLSGQAVAGISAPAETGAGGTYVNPVTEGVTETFADPTTIRGKDGWWYAFASRDRVLSNTGDSSPHRIAILRSKDQVDWSYVGDVFPDDARPSWQREGSDSWAPDIRYIDGRYVLYYSVANPPPGVGDSFTVAAATAPTPAGPWTDSGGPVIPAKGACDTFTDIDPAQITDAEGVRWLTWGSFRNLCAARLTPDGLRTTGPVTEIYTGSAEAPYVVRHDDWYYLFVSENNCCIGEVSSYQVRVGRSRSVAGPYVDAEGIPMTAPVSKGTFVVANNGNRWVGPGHMAVSTDRSGQDWLVYHAVPRDHPRGGGPAAGEPGLIRPMMIDRLDWIDGWPTVRAGAWASDTPQEAPVEHRILGGGFDDGQPLAAQWFAAGSDPSGWSFDTDVDSGRHVTHTATGGSDSAPAYLFEEGTTRGDIRARAELRQAAGSDGAVGLVIAGRSPYGGVVAWLDAGREALVLEARRSLGGPSVTQEVPLPPTFRYDTWHTVIAELRGRELSVEVSDAGQHDPVAEQTVTLPFHPSELTIGVAARGTRADADEVGAATLFEPVTTAVPDPALGTLDPAYSDEFDGTGTPGTTPGSPWSWVRQPVGTQQDGTFRFPTTGELYRGDNSASVLTRPAPAGNYTVETKFDFDGFTAAQQAGLAAYAGDDEYLKLTSVVLPGGPDQNTSAIDGQQRVTSFAKDVAGFPYTESYVGPPAGTLWMRLVHRVDETNGEHEYQAATSRDGEHWIYGAVWTLPASSTPDIGLVSLNTPGATAAFDYVRVYRP